MRIVEPAARCSALSSFLTDTIMSVPTGWCLCESGSTPPQTALPALFTHGNSQIGIPG